jgi:hypothetical protein
VEDDGVVRIEIAAHQRPGRVVPAATQRLAQRLLAAGLDELDDALQLLCRELDAGRYDAVAELAVTLERQLVRLATEQRHHPESVGAGADDFRAREARQESRPNRRRLIALKERASKIGELFMQQQSRFQGFRPSFNRGSRRPGGRGRACPARRGLQCRARSRPTFSASAHCQ